MMNAMSYPENNVPILEAEIVPSPASKRSINTMLTSRSGGLMLQNAMMEAGYDRCRALLTQSALENMGALTLMATRMSQIAPQSNRHYAAILEVYARKTTEQIERW